MRRWNQKKIIAYVKNVRFQVVSFDANGKHTMTYSGLNAIQASHEAMSRANRGMVCLTLPDGIDADSNDLAAWLKLAQSMPRVSSFPSEYIETEIDAVLV
jgi:hypothetical protein